MSEPRNLPKLMIVGGKPFNVPGQVYRHFEVIQHITQEQRKPVAKTGAEYILVIRSWVSHGQVRDAVSANPTAKVVQIIKGWAHMIEQFQKYGIDLTEKEPQEVPEEPNLEETHPEVQIPPPAEPEPEPEVTPAPEDNGHSKEWVTHVERWATKMASNYDRQPSELIALFLDQDLKEITSDIVGQRLSLVSDPAVRLMKSFNKSRGQYRLKRDGVRKSRKSAVQIPPEFMELARKMEEAEGLHDKLSKLVAERDRIEEQITGVQNDLKQFAEASTAMEMLRNAVKKL